MVLTLVFAILNICLGFALAMYLKNDSIESGGNSTDSSISGDEAGSMPAA
jgi:hypothetical protein